MVSRKVILWNVDTQADFMLPGGALYVPGAEKLIPNLKRLTAAVRAGRVFMIGDACVHSENDEEFKTWPPHCVRGTPGAEVIPETLADRVYRVPNQVGVALPKDFGKYDEVLLEKDVLNVFENPNAEEVVRLAEELVGGRPEYVVYGVVTEYCVRLAAKGLIERGRRVALVNDAIETLDANDGRRTIEELTTLGARVITTDEALAAI